MLRHLKTLFNLYYRQGGSQIVWDLMDKKEGVYNSVDLKRAVRYGYKITTIYKAIVGNIKQRFLTCILTTYFKRNVKLWRKHLNKQPHVEQSVVIETAKQLEKIRKHNHITEVKPLNGNKFIVSYIPNDKDKAVEKPSYIG